MEKRRVRIYKAQEGVQQQQADPQQILMQVASAIAPAELGGQGTDPNQVYMQLAQSYGEEVAKQLITQAVQYVQQMQQGNPEEAPVTQKPPVSDELNVQEDLLAQERERQTLQQEESFAAEDDEFMNELLYARYGGSLDKAKKQFVRSAVKLAKKQLGDAGKAEEGKADSTDIMHGRSKKSTDFLSGIKTKDKCTIW